MESWAIPLIIIGIIVGLIIIYKIVEAIKASGPEEAMYRAMNNELANKQNSLQAEYQKKEQELQKKLDAQALKLTAEKEKAEELRLYYEKSIRDFDKIIREKCSFYPQLATIMADIETLYYNRAAQYLTEKPRPAKAEAMRIKELRFETKQILAQKKLLEYKYNYIVELFPNVVDIFDEDFNNEDVEGFLDDENVDTVRRYLSEEEYKSLSVTERNQLALDNYIKRQKSKWQIGRDYEMYVGYVYRQKGYSIEYNGIIKRLEDLGRDIIATKGNTILVIQCKSWSQEKVIHEKHIFQLYGTVVLSQIENPFFEVKGVFIATTQLSTTAKEVAKYLNIEIIENYPLGKFPRIKCNINEQTGEKIYHLPFDQQYDNVKIINEGETYAFTVKEAEEQGFRRAYRWHANN